MNLNGIDYLDSAAITPEDALVVVDVQNDFMPEGALPVAGGDTIVPGINRLMKAFFEMGYTVVLTQDWHPPRHRSFAGAHEGKKPYDPYREEGIGPVLWPDHCVQGDSGADFHRELAEQYAHAVIRKGYRTAVDSYSGFLENDHRTETGLDGYLKCRGVKRIFLCGLALDYCVYFTAVDGAAKGYEVFCIVDLTMPVNAPGNSVSDALSSMTKKGIRFLKAVGVQC